jgi:hypothetical protein
MQVELEHSPPMQLSVQHSVEPAQAEPIGEHCVMLELHV